MSCFENFLCTVTLYSKQRRARELAAKGLKPDEIAELIGVSMRTVQRWFAKDRKLAADSDDSDDSDNGAVATVTATPSRQIVETESVRLKAIEMFENGFKPIDIAEELGIPLRRLERWVYSPMSIEEKEKIISTYSPEGQSIFVSEAPNSCWIEDVERVVYEHQQCHGEVRRKLSKILQRHLDADELNYRAIHVISMALIRHTDAERDALDVNKSLDGSRAFALLRSSGYSIIDVAEIEALQKKDPFP